MLNPVIEEIAGAAHSFLEFLFTFVPDHRIGIFARRHFGDTHDQIVLQKCVERTLGRFLPRYIGIKAEHDFTDETF